MTPAFTPPPSGTLNGLISRVAPDGADRIYQLADGTVWRVESAPFKWFGPTDPSRIPGDGRWPY